MSGELDLAAQPGDTKAGYLVTHGDSSGLWMKLPETRPRNKLEKARAVQQAAIAALVKRRAAATEGVRPQGLGAGHAVEL